MANTIIPGLPGEMHNDGTTRCIDSDRYRWIPKDAVDTVVSGGDTNSLLRLILEVLTDIRNSQKWEGRYQYISATIPANSVKYEIELSVPARMINIATDETITVQFNESSYQDILLRKARSPLIISDLPASNAIRKLIITTNTVPATVEILLFG